MSPLAKIIVAIVIIVLLLLLVASIFALKKLVTFEYIATPRDVVILMLLQSIIWLIGVKLVDGSFYLWLLTL